MLYVTMTDKFLSGWGGARGRIQKFVYVCETPEEAEIVHENAINRGDQKHVNICTNPPKYNPHTHNVEWKTKETGGRWYTKGAF